MKKLIELIHLGWELKIKDSQEFHNKKYLEARFRGQNFKSNLNEFESDDECIEDFNLKAKELTRSILIKEIELN